MPLDATTKDDVYVGRVRRDISRNDKKGLDLFVCGDQIKKGAALNAVQIAELVLKNGAAARAQDSSSSPPLPECSFAQPGV